MKVHLSQKDREMNRERSNCSHDKSPTIKKSQNASYYSSQTVTVQVSGFGSTPNTVRPDVPAIEKIKKTLAV